MVNRKKQGSLPRITYEELMSELDKHRTGTEHHRVHWTVQMDDVIRAGRGQKPTIPFPILTELLEQLTGNKIGAATIRNHWNTIKDSQLRH